MKNSFLIIQTAFLGDVILATALAESISLDFPQAKIDFLVQSGNESLLSNHPFIREVIVLEKKKSKALNLLKTALKVRSGNYNVVINLHRFGSSGFITCFSGAKQKIGFDKNPFSLLYSKKIKHEIGNGKHEIDRNCELIHHLGIKKTALPKLYPAKEDFNRVQGLIAEHCGSNPFICIAPASIWYTKQFPKEKWIEFLSAFNASGTVFLLGAKNDFALCEEILTSSKSKAKSTIINLAGKISLLQTAALMQKAVMNFVNDSAPMHIASAMNAPVTAVFCSTVKNFGFGPLSAKSTIIQTHQKLNCRPCGLHGFKTCPEGHFKCAQTIDINDLLNNGRGN